MTLGNGNVGSVIQTSNTYLNASNTTFKLSNILCAPTIKRELISFDQFCNDNLTSMEFFFFYLCFEEFDYGNSSSVRPEKSWTI